MNTIMKEVRTKSGRVYFVDTYRILMGGPEVARVWETETTNHCTFFEGMGEVCSRYYPAVCHSKIKAERIQLCLRRRARMFKLIRAIFSRAGIDSKSGWLVSESMAERGNLCFAEAVPA